MHKVRILYNSDDEIIGWQFASEKNHVEGAVRQVIGVLNDKQLNDLVTQKKDKSDLLLYGEITGELKE